VVAERKALTKEFAAGKRAERGKENKRYKQLEMGTSNRKLRIK